MGEGEALEFDAPETLLKDKESNFYKLWMEYEHANEEKKVELEL